jgi:hypothetical protein
MLWDSTGSGRDVYHNLQFFKRLPSVEPGAKIFHQFKFFPLQLLKRLRFFARVILGFHVTCVCVNRSELSCFALMLYEKR